MLEYGRMLKLFEKDTVQKALFFASTKHKEHLMGRPPQQVPYITHCFGVAMNVINFTSSLEVNKTLLLTICLLHDTLEDTNTTYDEINAEFGSVVADGVLALTRNPQVEYSKQIADCISRIKNQPKEVAIVKLADRMFNMRSRCSYWDKQKQDNYKIEGQMICDELGFACENLKNELQKTIDNY